MRRLSSTVVVVAGERAEKVVSGLDVLHNVRAITRGDRSPAEVAGVVNRSVATYVVHDADPLGAVGDAWVDLFDGAGAIGGLEVTIRVGSGRVALGVSGLVWPEASGGGSGGSLKADWCRCDTG